MRVGDSGGVTPSPIIPSKGPEGNLPIKQDWPTFKEFLDLFVAIFGPVEGLKRFGLFMHDFNAAIEPLIKELLDAIQDPQAKKAMQELFERLEKKP